jgi:hypothetical protein
MEQPFVSIIITTWNNEKDIVDCLRSILAQDYPHFNVVIVDSASSDNTVATIKQNFPQVVLIESKHNLYFTGGYNAGMTFAIKTYNPKYISIINPDTEVPRDWLRQLVDVAELDSSFGIVSPKIIFWKNKLINSAGLIYDGFKQAYDRGINEPDKGQYNKQEHIAAVSGCNMLIRSEVITQTGGFWNILKMYLEDLEFCIRVNKLGWKIVYAPNTYVLHKYMQSTSQSKSIKHERQLRRNWLLIALRHYALKSKLAMFKQYLFGS